MRCASRCRPRIFSSAAATSATRWRSATTRWQNYWWLPTSEWISTATSPAQRNWRRRFSQVSSRPSLGRQCPSICPEHELAVALEIGAGSHVQLAVLTDKEQRALRYLLGALQ